jgi:hypothetical protein
MVGRAILWLILGFGIIVAAISLGFALYMLGAALLDWLVSVALQTSVLKTAWEHPTSLITLALITAAIIAAAWVILPRLARSLRRAARRKPADDDDREDAGDGSRAGR